MRKYAVRMSTAERERVRSLVSRGTWPARTLRRANILLLADEGRSDAEIAEIVRCHVSTVERTRRRWAEEGVAGALHDRPRSGRRPALGPAAVVRLLALVDEVPPAGRKRWTLRLLAEQLVAEGLTEGVSLETVRACLRRHGR